ncbi:YiaA/YiaB family inner membrane protein [Leptolyngbya sp. NIES-2104]|uniref:YiaA/YiaB family inner membrane protein n=1 Tax=Leptolyngbya sp. NIES-2104 TaxID=1552121 RepID=UPI0006EC7F5C|nr:YiaA/YiaB family inner membrane protein [Leptolyngbya sp. NIES-2104]GAP97063.1 hypothetical protein NIES2104_36100 [Leptolyngbya sp. NIES-2104]
MQKFDSTTQAHSSAWIFQAWASFVISVTATTIGICYLPVDGWVKGYVGMGTLFTVASTFSVAKTRGICTRRNGLSHGWTKQN